MPLDPTTRWHRGSWGLARCSRATIRGLVALVVCCLTWPRPVPAAEVQITLAVNGQSFAPGSTLTLTLTVEAPGSQAGGDLYLAALTPRRALVFLGPGLRVSGSPVSFEAGRILAPGSATLGSVPLSSSIPAGAYQMYALVVRPGSSPFEPANHVSNLATGQFTFGTTLSRESATRLADQAVDNPSLILRTVNDNTRAVLRTLAALRARPGRSQAVPCPRYTTLDETVAPDRSGVTFSVLVDYGTGCADDDDGEFRRGSYLARFEITRFDPRTLDPSAGEATLIFSEFFVGHCSLTGTITDTFAPNNEEITGFTTETCPEETITLLYNLTTTFNPVLEIQFLNGISFFQSSVNGERAVLFEDLAFDQLTEVDEFTCDDPIGGQMTIGDPSDFATLRFGLPSPGCGSAFLSLNGGPEELVRLSDETAALRSASRTRGPEASPSRAGLRGIRTARRARPKTGR